MPRRPVSAAVAVSAVAACLSLAAPAAAHGPVAPVASDYLARPASSPPGTRVRVVDGDLRLWLEVTDGHSAVVLDYAGAPYLRIDAGGVSVNANSVMYYLNQTPVAATPPAGLGSRTPPHWVHAAGGRAYEWHDGRLHALATLAASPGVSEVGRWTVPLILDGRRTAIGGVLLHAPAPSIVWLWPAVVALLVTLAARRVHDARLDGWLERAIGAAALISVLLGALARGLHGRPEPAPLGLVEMGVAVLFCAWGATRLKRRPSALLMFVIAFGAIYEGAELAPTLFSGFTLTALPAAVTRLAAIGGLGAGASLLVLGFTGEGGGNSPSPGRRYSSSASNP